jgi:hypothetical protein
MEGSVSAADVAKKSATEEFENQFMSSSEQAPGPRGSPHDPQACVVGAELEELLAETANTESCGSSFVAWHFGHSAFSLP